MSQPKLLVAATVLCSRLGTSTRSTGLGRQPATLQQLCPSFGHFGWSLNLNKVKKTYSGLTVGLMNAAKYMEGVNNSHD